MVGLFSRRWSVVSKVEATGGRKLWQAEDRGQEKITTHGASKLWPEDKVCEVDLVRARHPALRYFHQLRWSECRYSLPQSYLPTPPSDACYLQVLITSYPNFQMFYTHIRVSSLCTWFVIINRYSDFTCLILCEYFCNVISGYFRIHDCYLSNE